MNRKLLKTALLVGVLILAAGAGQAWAQGSTATATFQVSATVGTHCAIEANPLNFGGYNPLNTTPVEAGTTVDVRCTRGTPYTIELDGGLLGTRQMADAEARGERLSYQLYQDVNYLNVWDSTSVVAFTAENSAEKSFPVYGRVTAAQDVLSGAYLDTVTATLNF